MRWLAECNNQPQNKGIINNYSSGVYSWSPAALIVLSPVSLLSPVHSSRAYKWNSELMRLWAIQRPDLNGPPTKNIFPLIRQKTFLEENKERGNGRDITNRGGSGGASPLAFIRTTGNSRSPDEAVFICYRYGVASWIECKTCKTEPNASPALLLGPEFGLEFLHLYEINEEVIGRTFGRSSLNSEVFNCSEQLKRSQCDSGCIEFLWTKSTTSFEWTRTRD